MRNIRHESALGPSAGLLHTPASTRDLAWLRRLVPEGAEQLLDFYARHDGLVLYQDTRSDTAGVALFRIADMERETESMWGELDDTDESDDPRPLKIAVHWPC